MTTYMNNTQPALYVTHINIMQPAIHDTLGHLTHFLTPQIIHDTQITHDQLHEILAPYDDRHPMDRTPEHFVCMSHPV